MPSNFPGAIDSFTDPLSNSPLNSPSHSTLHSDINDAVEKVETYMGLVKVIPTSVTGGTLAVDGTVTVGSTVSSVTISGAFSALYDSYRIAWNGIVGSIAANFTLQLSGITGNVYSTGGAFYNYGSTTVNGYGPAATSSWVSGPMGSVNSQGFCDLFAPFQSTAKGISMGGTTTLAFYSFWGTCTSTSSATGFVLAPNSGTMTGGTIRVYGYRN